MQANDFNKMISGKDDDPLFLSEMNSNEVFSKTKLQENKKEIDPELLKEIRGHVSKYADLGKSRRWIKRWVARKYNISTYA